MAFKPFDKVLVRDPGVTRWHPDFFEAEDNGGFHTIGGKAWSECIPYKGNELLCGTTHNPEDECSFKAKDIVAVKRNLDDPWCIRVFASKEQNSNLPYKTYNTQGVYECWVFCLPVAKIFPGFGDKDEHTTT